jgi:glycosyltransferase involved in cell wall biosynthesis
MKIVQLNGVFIVWKKFQRRVEVLAPQLGLEIVYFHYSWEEKSKFHKTLSYFLKTVETLKCLFHKRPSLIFVQLPPILALYYVAFYSWLTGSRYVSDCHNSMVYGHWYKWVLAKKLLAAGTMIVHNDHVAMHVENKIGITPFVLRTGIVKRRPQDDNINGLLGRLDLSSKCYVILPWNFNSDEPLTEVFEAIRLTPEIQFVMTWYFEKLTKTMRKNIPSNLKLTGFLKIDDFNQLFSNAGIALVLTNRDGTQLSGMHEAMAFGIPAVISDLTTTRFLYKNAPVYVKNTRESIAEGVRFAFENRDDLEERVKDLRIETEKEFSKQLMDLKAILNLDD